MLEIREPSLERHEERQAANSDDGRQVVQRPEHVFHVAEL
jgi:hypothetical protein